MKIRFDHIFIAFLSLHVPCGIAADDFYDLEGVNRQGVKVVYGVSMRNVCESGETEASIYFVDGGQIIRFWPKERCTMVADASGELQFSCAAENRSVHSYSNAVFQRSVNKEGECEYVCHANCEPHVPEKLSRVEMITIAPAPSNSRPTTLVGSEAKIVHEPSLDGVSKAFAESGLSRLSLRVRFDYNDWGRVVRAQMVVSSGSEALDASIVEWAMKLQLSVTKAGSGSLPIELE